MRIEQYAQHVALDDATEIKRVELLAYFFAEDKDQQEFAVSEMAEILVALGYARPNATRLRQRIKHSRSFIKGSKPDLYRLSVNSKRSLAAEFPDIRNCDDIISDSALIPEILFNEIRRPYLERTVQQINASYECNLFDACSLMMRRLLEVLLIHSFEHAGVVDHITEPDGSFQNLKTIINKAKSLPAIGLSASVRKDIDQFRELGNLSAHLVRYNCRRDDIRNLRMDYRATIEELLYKAGLKK
jgi:hypothetical protein